MIFETYRTLGVAPLHYAPEQRVDGKDAAVLAQNAACRDLQAPDRDDDDEPTFFGVASYIEPT